jgi:transcriptional regulator with GAF, ATPase, and Fis domain
VITASVGAVESFQSATRAFQRRLVSEVLETAEWNVTEAARRLDLTRSHLYNLIREFELQRPALTGGGAPRYPRGEEGAP